MHPESSGVSPWVPPLHPEPGCELCRQPGGRLVAQGGRWRVIRVEDADFPAFYRVVWRDHVAELSDLAPADRQHLLGVVVCVEEVVRERLQPQKINLASLGNVVPHLHWHVIGRYAWDSHFPQPVWGGRLRDVDPPAVQRLPCGLDEVDEAVRGAVAGWRDG